MKKFGLILIIAMFVVASGMVAIGGFRSKMVQTGATITAPSPTAGQKKESQAKLQILSGTATVTRGSTPITVSPGESSRLEEGDSITTFDDTVARIVYTSGTIVRVAPETTVKFHEPSGTTKLEELFGTIYVRFKNVLGMAPPSGGGFEVETPTAVAAVRGTKFGVWVKEDKMTRVHVVEHEVDVLAKDEQTGEPQEITRTKVKQSFQADIPVGAFKLKKNQAVSLLKQNPTEQELDWLKSNQDWDSLDDQPNEERLRMLLREFLKRRKERPTPTLTSVATLTPTLKPTPTSPPPMTQMPGDGFSRGRVMVDGQTYGLTCVGSTQGSMKVITDSANDDDCKDACPVMPLSEYASRNNGFAAINGMYFCPADYPSCAGKVNTFDTLFFNSRLKKYLNSSNNVYSVIPFLAIASDGTPIYKSKSLDWGRDTGIQAGTAGNPLLVQNGNLAFDANSLSDKQRNVKMNVGALVQKGNHFYMCVASGATVVESAGIYKSLGADNAINIDGGGSSALWYNGSYIFGPGRNIPTAIVFGR